MSDAKVANLVAEQQGKKNHAAATTAVGGEAEGSTTHEELFHGHERLLLQSGRS